MSETTSRPVSGLSAMRLDELKGVATSMGITGTAKMRKSDLVAAIKSRQSGGATAAVAAPTASSTPEVASTPAVTSTSAVTADPAVEAASSATDAPSARGSRRVSRAAGAAATAAPVTERTSTGTRARRVADAPDAPDAGSDRTTTASATGATGRDSNGARSDQSKQSPRADRQTDGDSKNGDERSAPTGSQTVVVDEQAPSVDLGEAAGEARRQRRRDRQDGAGQRDEGQTGRADRRDRQERQAEALRAVRETAGRQSDRDEQPGGSGAGDVSDRQTRSGRQDRSDPQDRQSGTDRQDESGQSDDHQQGRGGQGGQQGQQGQQGRYDDDERGSRRSRNRQRSRDRKRGRGTGSGPEWNDSEEQVNDDDVLVPVGGILDVLDNYAFVRTSGYLPGANDVYLPLGMVKKHSLRKGDAVTGAVKALREGEQPSGNVGRAKFNALVRLDSVNGAMPEESTKRVEFQALTPIYPQQRLRLETESSLMTTRLIDLVAPIGKGQRGLIVAPAKAGKTMILQALANAITTNNPECHLMVVLIDERPEEVTDMQRAVKGEVISSTFDRPAEDHTTVAELAIERAKRLVELGHDVVVLLDSITKLGRAYNLSAPASGRILSGGVDSAALYPPKKFFGAARNIENGGSLTIVATALVETGSKMDEVIFEEFKGTGNMELRLSRDLANRRIFPAVDINASGTRREEILLADEELKIMWKLRRVLAALDNQQGIELLLDRLRKTRTNYEFLTQVQATSSNRLD